MGGVLHKGAWYVALAGALKRACGTGLVALPHTWKLFTYVLKAFCNLDVIGQASVADIRRKCC